MFKVFVLIVFSAAIFFYVWGTIKAGRAGKCPNDRVFLVKTTWVLFFGSILWFIMGFAQIYAAMIGTINLVSWFTASWWCFVFALALAWKTYVFNKKVKELKQGIKTK